MFAGTFITFDVILFETAAFLGFRILVFISSVVAVGMLNVTLEFSAVFLIFLILLQFLYQLSIAFKVTLALFLLPGLRWMTWGKPDNFYTIFM